jgi:hypothetical protein
MEEESRYSLMSLDTVLFYQVYTIVSGVQLNLIYGVKAIFFSSLVLSSQ